MSVIIIIAIIWIVIAYIYSKVKNVSFLTAFGRIPVFVLSFLLDSQPSYINDAKKEAKKQGIQDVVDKINQQEELRKNMNQRLNQEKEKYKNDK